MATPESIKQQVAKAPEIHPLKNLLEKSVKEIGRALPHGMSPERVVRIALTCISQNPELAKCTPESFIGSLLVLSQLGLEPIAGRAYLLPFNNKRKEIVNGKEEWKTRKEVTALVGFKGLADLFYRHEASLSLDMQTVCKEDLFEYEYGTSPFLRHRPSSGDRGDVLGYYAVAKLRGGASLFKYMTKEECLEHGRKHSKTFDKNSGKFYESSPWFKDENAMCLKTVLIQLSKLLPLSVEMQKAISIDETSRDWRDGVSDAIDLPITTNYNDEGAEAKPIEKQNNVKSVPGGVE